MSRGDHATCQAGFGIMRRWLVRKISATCHEVTVTTCHAMVKTCGIMWHGRVCKVLAQKIKLFGVM
jgi:hypothetical protein